MNPKTTLAMGVAFLAVFVTLATLKLVHAPTDKEKREWQDKVLTDLHDLDADNLTQLALSRDKEQLEFNYVEAADRWQMTKPVDVAAQTSAVRDVFFEMKNLKRRTSGANKEGRTQGEGVIEPKSAADLVQYGLDAPATSVTLTFKPKGSDKQKSVTLQVGAATADKDGLYVKLGDEKYVFVVSKSSLRSLEKKLIDFRQQKLVTVSQIDSDQLRLEWPDRKIVAEKKDTKWQLIEPVSDRADSNKVQELIGKLGDLKADGEKDCVDDAAKDLAKYGLDAPQLIAEIRKPGSKPKSDDKKADKSKEKEKPTIVEKVLIGKPVEGRDDRVYAKLADQNYVIAVAANTVGELSKQPNDLRSHDLVEVTQGDVDYVRVHRPDGEVALRKDLEWEIVQPKTAKAEAAAVTELVRKIDEIDIKEFIDNADLKQFGLDQPAISVAIWQKGLKSDDKDANSKAEKKDEAKDNKESSAEPKGDPIRVSFGNKDDERKLIYVRRNDDATVFGVSSEGLLDLVDRGYLAYRKKSVLNFNSIDVAKLTVYRGGKTFGVERKKLNETDLQETWRLIEPLDAPADTSTVNRAVSDLSRLSAKRFFSEGEFDLKEYGLDEPRVRATVTLKAQGDKPQEQHVLIVGKETDDGGYYAKLGSENLLFSIDRLPVDDLQSELHDHTITRFEAYKVDGLTVSWSDGKKLELVNKKPDGQASKAWSVSGDDAMKLDTRKVNDLITQLALFNSDNFAQYTGDFTDAQGLVQPAALIEIKLEGESAPKAVRIGAAADGEKRYVASGEKSGPVALVSEDRFKELLGGPGYFAQAEEKKPDAENSEKSSSEKPDSGAKSDSGKPEAGKPDADKPNAANPESNKSGPPKSDGEKPDANKNDPAGS